MEFNELKQLIELFSTSDIDRLDLHQDKFNLKLAKNKEKLVAAPAVQVATPQVIETTAAPAQPVAAPQPEDDPNLIKIPSPIVGTFYRAPNPNADVFVKVGDQVRTGQTLCIVEAMKLMNEIQAEQDGEVAKILVENGQGVEYGQPLFLLKPH